VRHVRAPPGGVPLHDGLVDLEELRQRGTTGQPEQPDQPPAARQDTYTPTRIAAMMIRMTLVSIAQAP